MNKAEKGKVFTRFTPNMKMHYSQLFLSYFKSLFIFTPESNYPFLRLCGCVCVCSHVPVEYFGEDAGRVVAVGGGWQRVALRALRRGLARQALHPRQRVREPLQHLYNGGMFFNKSFSIPLS